MAEQIRERCIYCGGQILYSGLEKLVKCRFCGKTFSVTRFQSEQAKIRKALEEGERAKAALAEAEAQREEAQRRLNEAVESLTGIRAGQDTLSRLMKALADTQSQADGKLELLRDMTARLLNSQDDVLAQLDVQREIVSLLHSMTDDNAEQRRLERDFIIWCRDIHEEDAQRLERIHADADDLLKSQEMLNARVQALRRTSEEALRTLEAFRNEYQEDKLKALEQLYRQAEGFQRERQFDRAAEAYRQMLVKGGADAELYWRLVMCRYCLEYQRDDDGSLIPILLNPDLSDPAEIAERQDLLDNMDGDQSFYLEELGRIDDILDRYREVRHKVAFDVFISVKQSVNGARTADSDKASDLYDYITAKGLRVFNSRRTPIPAGQAYEPYIISALMSAKVLIVVGTKPEYINAQWVRNEWSRFQWLQRNSIERVGKTDRVMFCYLAGGMQPGQIPKALNPDREAILDGVGAAEQLDKALAFLQPKETQPSEPRPAPRPEPAPEPIKLEAVLRQMAIWLHNGQFDRVLNRFQEMTDQGLFLDCAKLHLNALCAERKVRDVEELVQSTIPLENESRFRLARKLCNSPEDQAWLDELLERNREYREQHGKGKGRGKGKGLSPWVVGLIAYGVNLAISFAWFAILVAFVGRPTRLSGTFLSFVLSGLLPAITAVGLVRCAGFRPASGIALATLAILAESFIPGASGLSGIVGLIIPTLIPTAGIAIVTFAGRGKRWSRWAIVAILWLRAIFLTQYRFPLDYGLPLAICGALALIVTLAMNRGGRERVKPGHLIVSLIVAIAIAFVVLLVLGQDLDAAFGDHATMVSYSFSDSAIEDAVKDYLGN